MKKILKEYFSFNKTERRGLFVLLTIIFLLIAANILLPYLIPKKEYDFTAFRKEIEEFQKNRVVLPDKEKNSYHSNEFDYTHPDKSAGIANLKPFLFDPNSLSQDEWIKLGLTARQITSIMNYKAKGGKYRSKEDFKKMYCISADEYEILAPFLLLPDEKDLKEHSQARNDTYTKEESFKVEINTAAEEELIKIKGIGDYFAKNIVKYRNSLGGFFEKSQLMEVNKMDSARFAQIEPFITLNPAAVRRIHINDVTFEELSKHPYIGYNIALSLINYRSKHGKFNKLQDIKNCMLVTEAVYSKISPYLRID